MINKIKADYKASLKKPPSSLNMTIAFLQVSGFRLSTLYRVAHSFRVKQYKVPAAIMTRIIRLSAPVDIEVAAEIGEGVVFPHPLCIVIGGKVKIGNNCKIMQGVSLGGSLGRSKADGQSQPILGNNVFLGAGCKIVGPVTIGDNVVIGANSVVTKDIPSNTKAFGIPATIR